MDLHVIEVSGAGPATHCPRPGKADPGYLCLYDSVKNAIGSISAWSDDTSPHFTTPSLGALVYWSNPPTSTPTSAANGP
jgi:hypothetical protein